MPRECQVAVKTSMKHTALLDHVIPGCMPAWPQTIMGIQISHQEYTPKNKIQNIHKIEEKVLVVFLSIHNGLCYIEYLKNENRTP